MSNALSSPSWWWHHVVLPNYEAYRDDRRSDWKAFNAVITMHHMWERVYWWNVEKAGIPIDRKTEEQGGLFLSVLRERWKEQKIEKQMGALGICANASKHSVQVRKAPVRLATESFDQIEVDDGEWRSAIELLNTARTFWSQNLAEFENMSVDQFKKLLKPART